MRCQDYQDLIDRGWRRCGNYCYKLRNENTCCPCYTIKCDALEFKLTKSNKRILRRMSRYLRDGKRESGSGNGGDGDGDADDAALHGEVNASEPQPQLPDKSPAVINVEQVASLVEAQKKPNPVAKPAPPAATGPSAPPPTLGTNKCAFKILILVKLIIYFLFLISCRTDLKCAAQKGEANAVGAPAGQAGGFGTTATHQARFSGEGSTRLYIVCQRE